MRYAPWPQGFPLLDYLEGRRSSYRERLHAQPRNYRGEPIPRIEIVRQNLRALGKPARAPRIP